MSRDVDVHVSIVPAKDNSDIKGESKYSRLNKAGFVRTQSAREQWILLVNDAWQAIKLPENDLIRDYLAIMLERYMLQQDLYHRLRAFNYYYRALSYEVIDDANVQDMADISLQYVALVPARSKSRNEPRSLSYSYALGEMLYGILARKTEGKHDWFSEAFQEMSNSFGTAVMVLRSLKLPMMDAAFRTEIVDIPSDEEVAEISQQLLLTLKTSVANS